MINSVFHVNKKPNSVTRKLFPFFLNKFYNNSSIN